MPQSVDAPIVASVSRAAEHRFSKEPVPSIELIEGLGVRGDAHAGKRVQHLSRVRRDPTQPNLRQVHLIPSELFDLAAEQGYRVGPGGADRRHSPGRTARSAGTGLNCIYSSQRRRVGAAAG